MARATPQLRVAVAQQRGRLAPEIFSSMLETIRSIFDKYVATLGAAAPGVERATILHQLMDRELKAAVTLPVTCRCGCASCCSYEVEITADEAELLREFVQAGYPIDCARLARLAARERRSPAWSNFADPENRCVFLGQDNACRVYDFRPAICRKHLVTTPAAACVTSEADVAPVQVLLAEILMSAQLSLDGQTFGSLPKMLQRSLAGAETPLVTAGAVSQS